MKVFCWQRFCWLLWHYWGSWLFVSTVGMVAHLWRRLLLLWQRTTLPCHQKVPLAAYRIGLRA